MNIPFAKIENFAIPPKDEGTIVMKCVWLDVPGERMLATDGHIAARLTIGVSSDDVSGLIPREVFDLARKELKIISGILGKGTIPDPQLKVIAGPDSIIIENLLTTTSHIVNRPKLAEGANYPNVDLAFAEIAVKPTVTIDPSLLSAVLASLDGGAVSLWISGAEKSVMLAAPSGKAIAVVMPMKAEIEVEEVNRRGKSRSFSSTISEVMQKTADLVNSGALDKDGMTVTCEVRP